MKTWISSTIDRRITEVMGVMNLATKDNITQLDNRITLLEEKLKTFELMQKSNREDN
jgi:polyhydroxyalkanoate synthesis regulator phasin